MTATRLLSAILIVLIGLNGWAAVAHASGTTPSAPASIAMSHVADGANREHCAKGSETGSHDHGWPDGASQDCCLAVFAAMDMFWGDQPAPGWGTRADVIEPTRTALKGADVSLHPRPPRA